MNEMQVFQNSEFGSLGVLEINGKPHFPATACAKILGYAKPHNAIAQHCRYSLKQGVPHPQNPGKNVEMNFISEGDLYRLIVHSKLPAAERFERWVFDEVLPSIRQTGGYGNMAEALKQVTDTFTAAMSSVLDRLAIISVGRSSPADAPWGVSAKSEEIVHSARPRWWKCGCRNQPGAWRFRSR